MKITPLVNLVSATTVLFACFELWRVHSHGLAIALPVTYTIHLLNTARHHSKHAH